MIQTSSAAGDFQAGAKFDFGMAELPDYPDVKGAPQNSIIGGASLWVMRRQATRGSIRASPNSSRFCPRPSAAAIQHEVTGLSADHQGGLCRDESLRILPQEPGPRNPVIQMTAKPPTENSRGLRLGNLVQIRDIIAEDLEAAFAGKQDAQSALDDAVKRGNGVLRQFERNTQQ